MSKKIAPKVIGLFSGCGGFEYGFKKSGFKIVYANDNEKNVKETYEFNIKHTIEICDIHKVNKSNIPQGDVILAGIPCQPFSNAGNRKSTKDKDGNLFIQVLDVIKNQKNPVKVVVFENVRGFLSSKDDDGTLLTERLKNEMKELGYDTTYKLLNASDYGIPSNRYRVFIVCILSSLNIKYEFPYSQILTQKVTVGDVLSKPLPRNEVQEIWKLTPATLKVIKYIKEGGSWKDIPYKHLLEPHKKIRDNMKKYRSPNFTEDFPEKKLWELLQQQQLLKIVGYYMC